MSHLLNASTQALISSRGVMMLSNSGDHAISGSGLTRNYRQHYARAIAAVVEDALMRPREFSVGKEIVPSVGIPIVTWKITRRDLQPQAMPSPEQVAGRP